jgi:hypothetical protein
MRLEAVHASGSGLAVVDGVAPKERDAVREGVGLEVGDGVDVGVPLGVTEGVGDGKIAGASATPRNSVPASAATMSVAAHALVQLARNE